MKSVQAWLSCFLLLILVSDSTGQAPEPEKAETKAPSVLSGEPLQEDAKDDELRKLMKARYNEALVEAEVLSVLYQHARVSYESVSDARQRQLQAGLDLCDKPTDKVTLLTQFVELAKTTEEMAKASHQAAKGTEAAVHRARYQRLDAEIQLLRAKREANNAKGR